MTDTPPQNGKKSRKKPSFVSIAAPSWNSVSKPPPGITQGKPRPPNNEKKDVEKPRFGSTELPSWNSVSKPPPGITQGKPRPLKSN